jgi:integrase
MSLWSHRRDVASCTCLRVALDETLITCAGIAVCGPQAIQLYQALSPHLRHIHGLQCWFALRYSEIGSIPIQLVRFGHMVPIHTTKGGRDRFHSSAIARNVKAWSAVHLVRVPECHTYDAVSLDVSHAIGRLGIPVVTDMHRATHIWRHLRAEYLVSRGASLDEIAAVLGHKSLDSTRRYLPGRRVEITTPPVRS